MGRYDPSSRKGIALLLTLLVITIMILTIGQISYSTKVEVQIANNFREDLQNLKAAQSGVYLGIAFLQLDAKKKGEEGYHSLQDGWANGIEPQTLGKSTLTVTLKDEERKFNILQLIRGSESDQKETKAIFMRYILELFQDERYDAEGLANTLISWMKNEIEERKGRSLVEPLYSLQEFKLIPEFLTTYFPEEALYNFSTLTDAITFLSSGKINVNTASAELLISLHEKIPEEFIALILQRRTEEEGYFKSIQELQDTLDLEKDSEEEKIFNDLKKYLVVKSDFFSSEIQASTSGLSRSYRAYYSHSNKDTNLIHWEQSSK
ncbi:MAG: type II secretion system protein GspK [Planctomycetota bacterium]